MIKRSFKINDENYSEEFEIFGKGGILKRDDDEGFSQIWVLECAEIAQEALENTEDIKYDEKNDLLLYNKESIKKHIVQRVMDMANIIIEESIENAIENIEDYEDSEFI